ncbi:NAD(P)-dependent oxidoreductase [Vineibacter terrae]|uniref:dihydrouracil dehydrogenase (NAD(+)) n=1 Tax=Vineibacter terrae TaxID=2586908 RepID=A0A5C8PRC4_9HYPH|nr:NAD(P)-dependent oxidoreductase [Vineibacter terrae]TXL78730.1 NAD(P)-dependent oxidoreductase [Vineibacter terrae]
MPDIGDIAANRLSADQYQRNFDDIEAPLDRKRALVEASRCYFCHDAPCLEACPTGIDIPGFIRKIATDNVKGSAVTILEENIMGGACARVCPTEILCEQACVRTAQEGKPVNIGALQRYATDWLLDRGIQPFQRAKSSGKTVAVVGAGPAGLACAHRLALLGHAVTVFEARPKAGGLNEHGVAAYKVPHDFAQREVGFILSLGGIELRTGQALGRDVTLAQLRRDHDAVFIGTGLGGVNALQLDNEALAGVEDAVAYIERLRQADDKSALSIGRRVVVIGGGNTAIDIAVQARRLGAEDVTIVYRRGPQNMGATGHEQDFAQTNGVRIRHWARPVRLIGDSGRLAAAEFESTAAGGPGRRFTLETDMLFKAIGQVFVAAPVSEGGQALLELQAGRIAVDAEGRTSLPDVWAGGDCVAGPDLTVSAVQDGKRAAHAIDRYLRNA